nr:hypothetical protein [Aquihabitans sp. G128]
MLMVSLNTWPQVGFSRKRSMEPSSWVMTMPNFERVVDRHQADGGERLLLVVEGQDLAEVDVGEHVAGDHEEALGELGHGVAHGAGGAERLVLGGVDDLHAELGAVAEVGADLVGEERHRDHDLVDPVLLEQVDDVLHHRPVGQREHGLRAVRGERTQPRPLASCHDHGLHGRQATPGQVAPNGPERVSRNLQAASAAARSARPSRSALMPSGR